LSLPEPRHANDRFALGRDPAVTQGFSWGPYETIDEPRRWIGDAHVLKVGAKNLELLRRAAEAGVAPAVIHIDDARAAAVSELVALPERHTLLEGHFCHASPLNDMESFGVEAQDGEERLLDGVRDRRVVFGHTHVQFSRTRADGIELVNPGSAGMPMDGDHRAAYALITPENAVVFRRVAYDHETAAAETRKFHGGHGAAADTYAGRIANAHL
jgi:diadenosine tetraphosphatase ApaH/serine/threonine PP2A family protein phosphatase